jgi:hypothetical protein
MRDGAPRGALSGVLPFNQGEPTMNAIVIGRDQQLTFFQRLAALRAATVETHYNAALAARAEFESQAVSLVSARVHQILNAVVAD